MATSRAVNTLCTVLCDKLLGVGEGHELLGNDVASDRFKVVERSSSAIVGASIIYKY